MEQQVRLETFWAVLTMVLKRIRRFTFAVTSTPVIICLLQTRWEGRLVLRKSWNSALI